MLVFVSLFVWCRVCCLWHIGVSVHVCVCKYAYMYVSVSLLCHCLSVCLLLPFCYSVVWRRVCLCVFVVPWMPGSICRRLCVYGCLSACLSSSIVFVFLYCKVSVCVCLPNLCVGLIRQVSMPQLLLLSLSLCPSPSVFKTARRLFVSWQGSFRPNFHMVWNAI